MAKKTPPVAGSTIHGDVTAATFIGRDQINITITPPDPGISALHQLPEPPADFVGRAAELDELCAAVQTQGALICGLTGLGGVGKTALGLVLAHRLKAQYPAGQLYIHLRGASNNPVTPAAALEKLIRAFEPMARLPEDVEQLTAIYRSLLAEKPTLVFLDDARDAAQVRALLPPHPALAIITSRRRFDLAGYHTRDVSALPLDDAVKLICTVWGQTADVTALATRCGCLPMALRAAGALLKRRPDLTPTQVDTLLADAARRLALADPERDTTVAAAFQASYDQLTPELQTCWRALGIFPADFDAPAAEVIWQEQSNESLVGMIFRLVILKKPLLNKDPGEILSELHAAGLVDYTDGRWRLHDLARDFTRALCTPAEMDALAYGHANYYLKVLEECGKLYEKGNDSILAGLVQFDQERVNIEAGQAWATAHTKNRSAALLRIMYPIAGYNVIKKRLHPRTRITWLEAGWGVGILRKILGNYMFADAYKDLGEPRRAIEIHEKYLTIARKIGLRSVWLSSLLDLGGVYRDLGEPRRALDYYEQALVIARKFGYRDAEADALGDLGDAYKDLSEPRRAIEYYEQMLVIAREIGNRHAEADALGDLGDAYKDLSEPRRAIDYYEQQLVLTREIGDWGGESNALNNLGHAWAGLGEPHRRIEYYEQALAINREIGNRRGEGGALCNLGNAYNDLGEPRRALDYYEQALVIAREIEHRRNENSYLNNLGVAYKNLGEPRRAIAYYEQALVIAREIGARRAEGHNLINLGVAYIDLGEPRRAIDCYDQALVVTREIGDRRGEGDALGNLGIVYKNLGEPRRAIAYYEQALVIAREVGDRQDEANNCWNLGLLLEKQGELPRAVELMQVRVDFLRAISHPDAEEAAEIVEQTRKKM